MLEPHFTTAKLSFMADKEHILVVEDEEHLAMGIKYNLVAEGYRVTVSGDGRTAIKLLTEPTADIDLVVLDLMLPGMSGYAVCESLRAKQYVLLLAAFIGASVLLPPARWSTSARIPRPLRKREWR